jgi:hypothetical protein
MDGLTVHPGNLGSTAAVVPSGISEKRLTQIRKELIQINVLGEYPGVACC